jgi:hypothetical protein
MVSVRGKVVKQVNGDAAEKHIDKLAKKYMGLDKYPGRSAGEKRIILKIKPEKDVLVAQAYWTCPYFWP